MGDNLPYSAGDADAIEEALRKYHAKIKNRGVKVWFNFVDLEHVIDLIVTGGIESELVNGYLVVYAIGSPWYAPNVTAVEELLILQVYPNGALQDVTDFLEYMADVYDAAFVKVGTALAGRDKALATMYESLGYVQQDVGLIKLINRS